MLLCKIKKNTDDYIYENNTKNNNPQINIQRFSVLSDFSIGRSAFSASQSTYLRVKQYQYFLSAALKSPGKHPGPFSFI
jgi:hypothetical protein